jgi:hypothetical protein
MELGRVPPEITVRSLSQSTFATNRHLADLGKSANRFAPEAVIETSCAVTRHPADIELVKWQLLFAIT